MKCKTKFRYKIISSVIAVAMMFSLLSGCAKKDAVEAGNFKSETSMTSISDTMIVTSNTEFPEITNEIDSGEIDDIYSLVCSSVEYKLKSAGFETGSGIAYTTENDNYSALGIYYYSNDLNFIDFGTNSIKTAGFIEIVDDNEDFFQADNENSLIVVDSLEGTDNDTEFICAYNYDNVGSSHFVYKDKYVTYYQQTPMRIVYSETENISSNYDLSLGSIYDYDNNRYIYDESIFNGEYITHSSAGLFTEEDYSELENDFKKNSEEQEKAGYIVEEYTVLYIPPENIQSYIDGGVTDTFFGYSVNELTETFGFGTALEYSDGKLVEANYKQNTLEEYDWGAFLTKVGIGFGILIIGAVVTPAVGGTSFAVTIITTLKATASLALADALGTLTIETAQRLIDGKSIEQALESASCKGLDGFANSFVVVSAFASAGQVISGVLNPVVRQEGQKLLDATTDTLRNKAVVDAWKIEQDAVRTGTSRYKWTLAQKHELLKTGKVAGYEGHHILTVNDLEGTVNQWLIGSPNDIVFLSKKNHFLAHGSNYQNSSDIEFIVKLLPWAEDKVKYLLNIAA